MKIVWLSIVVVSLCGCVIQQDPFLHQSHPYPPPGLYPQGPMPTGQVPYGTLTPSVIHGQYWVTGQPYGTVHGH